MQAAVEAATYIAMPTHPAVEPITLVMPVMPPPSPTVPDVTQAGDRGVACPRCGYINGASRAWCKRCRKPLPAGQRANMTGDRPHGLAPRARYRKRPRGTPRPRALV